jgi:ammonia channel protein AmtB
MYQSLKTSLNSWNNTTTDRQKLQHMYIASAVFLTVVAGVLGLLNQSLGQQILAIAIAAAAAFLINAIAWALLQSFVLLRLEAKPETSADKPTTSARKK